MIHKANLIVKKLLRLPQTFILLAGLYPTIFLISKNWFVYNDKQLLFLLTVPTAIFFIGLLISPVLKLLNLLIRKFKKANRVKTLITRLHKVLNSVPYLKKFLPITKNVSPVMSVYALAGFIFIYILIEASIENSKLLLYGYIFAAIVLTMLIKKVGYYFLNLTLTAMTIMAFVSFLYAKHTKTISDEYLVPTLDKERDDSIVFKTKPNIYLIHLESYHSPLAMRELYNFDNSEFVNNLTDKGFEVADENYSNYSSTITSTGSIFLMDHHYGNVSAGLEDAVGIRDMVGGLMYNPVLKILKNNKYKILYLHADTYGFTGNDNLDVYEPKDNIHDSLLIFQNNLILDARAKIFDVSRNRLNKKSAVSIDDSYIVDYIYQSKDALTEHSLFYYLKLNGLGARHSPSNGSYIWKNAGSEWDQTYIDKINDTNPKIEEFVDRLLKTDPNGIFILYGDHGAWKYRNIWKEGEKGKDLNELIYERKQINSSTLAMDIFGTFFAIRFPGEKSIFLENETHVNIFRSIFSTLSETETLLNNKPANESYLKIGKENYVLARDGKPLDKMEIHYRE